MMHEASDGSAARRPGRVKCVVWDLDDTLWDGVLLEGAVTVRAAAAEAVHALDGRGILQSIASRNEHQHAMQVLRDARLDEFFLFPQIGWNAKAESIRRIAQAINIGPDAIAFIDDQPFERDEVRFSLPDVLCIDATELSSLLSRPELSPRFVTGDAARRRQMYVSDIERSRAEEAFVGPKHAFLATLGMRLTIAPAGEGDLQRAEELTLRTHQLNTTGYTYSYEELEALRRSADHKLLVAEFADRYGSYGKIGLALLECGATSWTLKLFLLSCRVMSRGIGAVMLRELIALARNADVPLYAEFRPNERNRMMHVSLRLAGFKEVGGSGPECLLLAEFDRCAPPAELMEVRVST